MSDQDQNKAPQNEDDELESLSAEEKVAFEKIMAEIAAATGNDAAANKKPEDKSKDTASIEVAQTPSDDASSQSDPQDTLEALTPGDDEKDTVPSQGDSTSEAYDIGAKAAQDDAAGTSDAAEELNDEQQAALDQIMAEIEAQGKSEPDKKEPSVPPEADEDLDEDLDHDQQAALDQIMAEIESKRKPEPEKAAEPVAPAGADEELDEDQQAALNQIMAEIESKRKPEPEKTAEPVAPAGADEELDEDQQAALNQIMAEIESKRKGESGTQKESDDATGAPVRNEEVDPDQDAALQNILNEINAQKTRSAKKISAASGPNVDELTARLNADDAADPTSPPESNRSENRSLTMEEFDDELSNLLSTSQDSAETAAKREPPKQTETKDEPALTEAKQPSPMPGGYPVLQEVTADPVATTKSAGREKGIGPSRHLVRRLLYGVALIAGLIVIATAGLWAYRHFRQYQAPQPVAVSQPDTVLPPEGSPEGSAQTESPPPPTEPAQTAPSVTTLTEAPIVSAKRAEFASPADTLTSLKANLEAARKQLQSKIFDIQQLKSYYERGVVEESEKIEDQLANGQIPTFEDAVANKAIELGLRAIQRRQTYIHKLDTPLGQLTAMSEELLFLERRAQTYEILNSGINGLPVDLFKQDVTGVIGSYLRYNTQLSIDEVDAVPPALTEIWGDIVADLKNKTSLLAQREPLNRAISAEICKGVYGRKYQLTALSAATAQCLIKWNGKDLYLNALTDLPPDVAEVLSQWPGEWLSLNGVRELSAESASYLAQWSGKRLSLNGLSELSPEATAQLSKWKGQQLEMVGLKSIGRWENYGTRLFLSEKLRRQLEAQLE